MSRLSEVLRYYELFLKKTFKNWSLVGALASCKLHKSLQQETLVNWLWLSLLELKWIYTQMYANIFFLYVLIKKKSDFHRENISTNLGTNFNAAMVTVHNAKMMNVTFINGDNNVFHCICKPMFALLKWKLSHFPGFNLLKKNPLYFVISVTKSIWIEILWIAGFLQSFCRAFWIQQRIQDWQIESKILMKTSKCISDVILEKKIMQTNATFYLNKMSFGRFELPVS